VDSLQLEVSLRTRRCLWLWGYSPRTRWISGKIADPEAEDGSAEVHGVELARGISIKVPGAPFRKLFDAESGWFGVFGSNRVGGQGVRIATDTVLFVRDGVFRALLVRPVNWRELAKLQPL
jgi:hypothetical protein